MAKKHTNITTLTDVAAEMLCLSNEAPVCTEAGFIEPVADGVFLHLNAKRRPRFFPKFHSALRLLRKATP